MWDGEGMGVLLVVPSCVCACACAWGGDDCATTRDSRLIRIRTGLNPGNCLRKAVANVCGVLLCVTANAPVTAIASVTVASSVTVTNFTGVEPQTGLLF